MGSSASKPSPLAPTFERIASWDFKASKRLLSDYKEKDLDFGLDAQGLTEICGGDNAWAEAIIDAFGGANGIVNALAFICGSILVSGGAALEKASLVFDALDFDMTEQISMDEMTIVFLCCARGFCVMSGTGRVPTDEELENVTLQGYRELSKSAGISITKNEFTKWVLKYIAAAPLAVPHTEVTLDDMSVQFGLVEPAAKSMTEEVLAEMAAENNAVSASEDPAESPPNLVEDTGNTGDIETAPDDIRPTERAEDEAVAPCEPLVQDEYGGEDFQAETPRGDIKVALPPTEVSPGSVEPFEDAGIGHAETGEDEGDPFAGADEQFATGDSALPPEPGLPEGESSPDLNAFDTYDYANSAYDSSSGLPPPDPQDSLSDSRENTLDENPSEPHNTTMAAE